MITGLITAAALAASAPAVAGDAPRQVATPTYVKSIATSAFSPSSPDPAGLAYVAATDEFIVSDSEVDEIPQLWDANNINLYTTPRGSPSGTGTGRTRPASQFQFSEPAGLGYDPATQTLFVSDDDQDRVIMLRRGADGKHGTADDDSQRTRFSTDFNGVESDPEGVEFDEANGHLYVCDGAGRRIFDVTPVNGFDTDNPAPDDDVITNFDLAPYGMTDCEGLGHDPTRGTLLAVEPVQKRIYEFNRSGTLRRIVDIRGIPAALRANANPASVSVAPSSDPLDDPATMSYWVADRQEDEGATGGNPPTNPNENDGQLHEFLRPAAEPDPAAPVSFSAAAWSTSEAGPNATISLRRPVGGAAATVRVTTTALSATAGSDFTPVDQVVSFAAGATSAAVSVPILQDTLDEPDEAVQLNLSDPTGDALVATPASATLNIVDDDPEPALAVADVQVTEGQSAQLTVALSAASAKPVSFAAVVEPGTASSDDHGSLEPAEVTVPPGITTATLTLPTTADALDEADEQLEVRLTDLVNAVSPDPTAAVVIVDDDPEPTLSVGDAQSTEGADLSFTVSLSVVSGRPVRFAATTEAGTAATSDFEPVGLAGVTIPPGVTSVQVLVPTVEDLLDEPDETLRLRIGDVEAATLGVALATGTILDDDPAPTPTPTATATPTGPVVDRADLRAAARRLLRKARRAWALRGRVLRLGGLAPAPYARTVAVCATRRPAARRPCRRITVRVPAQTRRPVRLRLRRALVRRRTVALTITVRALGRQGTAAGRVRLPRRGAGRTR